MTNRTTANNRSNALATNYIYMNEDKISNSLICPICLDPLVDPQMHVQCESSFCDRCIKKLNHCPCCRMMIIEPCDLKTTNHVIRNILNELQVQCNICKQVLCRGDFLNHIQNSCLILSATTTENDTNIHTDKKYVERHFSNLYRRLNTIESDLSEIMQPLRTALNRRFLTVIQQVRSNGSDPSTGIDRNRTKTTDKNRKSKTIDDTQQPGVKRQDWSDPNKTIANDPPYGKAGGSIDTHDVNRGKKP